MTSDVALLRQRAQEEAARKAAEEAARAQAEADTKAALDRAFPHLSTFRDALSSGGEGPEMIVIPEGEFMMGSPEDEPERESRRPGVESPQHPVRIAHRFGLGKYAVTFDEYDAYCAARGVDRPSDEGWGGARRPVIKVSWDDAQAYCRWLSDQTGAEYRLPSEAEWEYACRAGTTTPFWWGREITPGQANYIGDSVYAGGGMRGVFRCKTEPVDAFTPNPWGLYQTHGNVLEWCEDAWNETYANAPADGSAWILGDSSRAVLRGGSWSYVPDGLRSAARNGLQRDFRYRNIGFRVARTIIPL